MFDIRLNPEIIKKSKLSLDETIALIAIQYELNLNQALLNLVDKGLIATKYFQGKPTSEFFVSQQGTNILNDIILDNIVVESKLNKAELTNLATTLVGLYPKGTKPGTNQSWRGSVKDIEGRLTSFFKLYGNKYTHEEIINTTRNYVTSYQNDRRFMKTLQYFIWKEKGHYEGGTVARNSELATMLENPEEVVINMKEDWTSHIK